MGFEGQKSSLIQVKVLGGEGEDQGVVGWARVHFLRRTAVFILRPAMGGCPAGTAGKVLTDPMLNAGVGEKL